MMGDCGVIQLILCALKKHKDEGRVVKNACMALATIVEADGKWIYLFILITQARLCFRMMAVISLMWACI